jgi:hypothetical protein
MCWSWRGGSRQIKYQLFGFVLPACLALCQQDGRAHFRFTGVVLGTRQPDQSCYWNGCISLSLRRGSGHLRRRKIPHDGEGINRFNSSRACGAKPPFRRGRTTATGARPLTLAGPSSRPTVNDVSHEQPARRGAELTKGVPSQWAHVDMIALADPQDGGLHRIQRRARMPPRPSN